ncbi:hypothetical protein EV384_3331 [Micromonospora kangleipakensis]|uniref:Uncharacterized protein n=1 Tax=Micromonospora kangleipakensis TaxID=1077942 RepID=A0A4Q8BCQ4_9ACTN|nr:hypothetical protein [Micromonospora kangleipakensis]RZU74849.1 hypothetical protein EV384_3331 [Micromonospora kangleipakensis]
MLVWGTGVHVADLIAGGTDPYPWAPAWLAAYLVSLTVADPVAAALLLARRRIGMDLTCLILVTDAAANGWALYGLHGGDGAARTGHAAVTAIALGSLVARRALRPLLGPPAPDPPGPACQPPATEGSTCTSAPSPTGVSRPPT